MSTVLIPDEVEAAIEAGPGQVARAVEAVGGTPFHSEHETALMHVGVADAVYVRHFLDIFPEVPEFTRIGEDIWATAFPFPADARIEYKLSVVRHGRHRLRLDALNPMRAPNPWGSNSELRGARYAAPQWTAYDSEVGHGVVVREEFASRVFGDERAFHLYTPAGGVDAAAVIVVHDGDEYLEFAALGRVLDNLIAAGDIPPVAAVMINPGDRFAEYRADTTHARHVVEEIIPRAQAAIGAVPVVAMGASLGGVASLHAAWRHPDVFDGLILQAGSFVTAQGPHGRGPVFAPVIRFMKEFLAAPGKVPDKIHVSCGRFDGLINEAGMMSEFLAEQGAYVGYEDVWAGHDWHAWRDMLRPALQHVLANEEG